MGVRRSIYGPNAAAIAAQSLRSGQSVSQILPSNELSAALVAARIPAPYVDTNSIMSYASNSPFTQPIPADAALDANSATWAGYFAGAAAPYAKVYDTGIAVYNAVAGDTTYTIVPHNTTGQGGADWGPNPLAAYPSLHIPAAAAPVTGSDGWMIINDPVYGIQAQLWHASYSGGNWHCDWAGVFPIGQKGYDVIAGSSGMAGLSIAAGIVSRSEITAANAMTVAQIAKAVPGPIPHALGLVSSMSGGTFRYPALKSAGSNIAAVGTPIPAGTRFQLDPSIDLSAIAGMTVAEAAVGRALQLYGCYLNDQGDTGNHSGFYFESEDLTDAARSAPTLPGSNVTGVASRAAGGIYSTAGITTDYFPFSHIPWSSFRGLATASVPTALVTPKFYTSDPSEPWDNEGVIQTTHPVNSNGATGTALTAGVLTVMKWKATRADYFSKCDCFVSTQAATGISNCYIAVYGSDMKLIGVTADQSAVWNSTGSKTAVSLNAVHAVEPGDWGYVAFLIGAATTKPIFLGIASGKTVILNSNSGTAPNYGTAGSSLTAAPGTLTTVSASGTNAIWCRLTR